MDIKYTSVKNGYFMGTLSLFNMDINSEYISTLNQPIRGVFLISTYIRIYMDIKYTSVSNLITSVKNGLTNETHCLFTSRIRFDLKSSTSFNRAISSH